MFFIHQFCLTKIRKTHKKALGKAWKSGAEGVFYK